MGLHPTCLDPTTEYLLMSNCVLPVKFCDGAVTLDPARPPLLLDNGQEMWCVREIAPNVICVGFYSKTGLEIYEGTELKRTIDAPGSIFALISPPGHNPWQGMPSKLIALDN